MSFFALLTLDEIMIPDRIGNIGKTQGVNDKSNPETKNPNKERIKFVKSKSKLKFKKFLNVNENKIKIFEPNFSVFRKIKK